MTRLKVTIGCDISSKNTKLFGDTAIEPFSVGCRCTSMRFWFARKCDLFTFILPQSDWHSCIPWIGAGWSTCALSGSAGY